MSSVAFACHNNKFFIGKTKRKLKKNTNCFDIKNYTSTCAWTNKYKLKDVIEITEKSANDLTLEYMNKYGIENVRGGSWQQMELSEIQKLEIKKLIEISLYIKVGLRANESPHDISPRSKDDDFPAEDWIDVKSEEFLLCTICSKKFDNIDAIEQHEKACVIEAYENSTSLIDIISNAVTCSLGAMNYVSSFINS
jgi:hypothetical protein